MWEHLTTCAVHAYIVAIKFKEHSKKITKYLLYALLIQKKTTRVH